MARMAAEKRVGLSCCSWSPGEGMLLRCASVSLDMEVLVDRVYTISVEKYTDLANGSSSIVAAVFKAMGMD